MRKIFFASIFLFILILSLTFPRLSFADQKLNHITQSTGNINQDPISGSVPLIAPLGPEGGQTDFDATQPGALGAYINNVYFYAIGLGALLAMGIIIFGAIRYMAERGQPFLKSDAKTWIFGGVIGLMLLIGATLILTTLNRDISDISVTDRAINSASEEAERAAARARSLSGAATSAARNKNAAVAKAGAIKRVDDLMESRRTPNRDALIRLAAKSLIEGEYNVGGISGAEDGYLEGMKEAFNKHSGLLEEYARQKALKHSELTLQDRKPTSWLDDRGNPPGSELPDGIIEIMRETHKQERIKGTNHQLEDNQGSANEIWSVFVDISDDPNVAPNSFPGHEGAKDGVYEVFKDVVLNRHTQNSQVTANAFLEYADENFIDNWLTQRIRQEIESNNLNGDQ